MMEPYYSDESVTLYHGDALAVLRELPDASVDCCVTSPPYYGLRDYGEPGQYGLESSPAEYVENLRAVFGEVRRVLAPGGTLWLNLGDSYVTNGSGRRSHPGYLGGRPNAVTTPQGFGAKPGVPKNLLGIPWRVAFALQDDGWILRNAIVWDKPNAMPESVTDRLSTTYEMVFMLTKSRRYWFNLDSIREPHVSADRFAQRGPRLASHAWIPTPGLVANNNRAGGDGVGFSAAGRNPGDVWAIPTSPFMGWEGTDRSGPDHHDPDGPAYGIRRIESPDCPVHGCSGRPEPTTGGGEHEAVSTSHSDSTGAHHAQGRAPGFAPTVPSREPETPDGSLDSHHLSNGSPATPHSSQSHRTDHGPETSLPYMPSARSRSRTGRSEESHGSVELPLNISASRTDAREHHVERVRMTRRTLDTCTCSWTKPSSGNHFAVMAPELARRCVVAGCKPGGVVLDPFCGSGTTGMVANQHGRRFVGIDLSSEYLDLALRTRLRQGALIEEAP